MPEGIFQDLSLSEAALLPGAEESHGAVRRFQIAPRLTSHVRHRTKYLDMPVADPQAFVFTGDGAPGPRARSLKDFVDLLGAACLTASCSRTCGGTTSRAGSSTSSATVRSPRT